MAKAKRKKGAISGLLGCIVIAFMIVVFIYQQIVPANFGKEYDHLTKNTKQLNIAFTAGSAGGKSYFTEDPAEIKEFRDYIDNIKLRYKTLADTMSANKKDMERIYFAIVNNEDTISSFQVDEKGLVQFNTRVFKVTVPFDEFRETIEEMAKSWGDK